MERVLMGTRRKLKMRTLQLSAIKFKLRRVAMHYSMLAVVLANVSSSRAMAQDDHAHMQTEQHQEISPDRQRQAGDLIRIVRESTERFKDVSVAEAEGYALQFGCVTGPDAGAMGLHFLNGAIIKSGVLDATRPQAVIYEPRAGGGLRLIGVDYLLFADPWNKKNQGPPQLMGQLFHLFDSPNRFGLPAFYTLHVWAWKENPNGAFVNWHPKVSCESFSGRNP
jgi:hypothetical protein